MLWKQGLAHFVLLLVLANPELSASDENSSSNIIQSHGLSLIAPLKYPNDFQHLDYVNPDAPKGGTFKLSVTGSFDSLNPYVLKGAAPSRLYIPRISGATELHETLLVGNGPVNRSGDEIQSAYGLIAKNIRYPKSCRWIEFNIRPEARFHDGTPITANDVQFSFYELKNNGHPLYQQVLESIESLTVLSSHNIDRVMLWQYRLIPAWHSSSLRIAHWRGLKFPDNPSPYSFQLNTWWFDKDDTIKKR